MIWKDINIILPEMQIGKEVITCYDCSAMQIDSHTPTFLPKASVEIGPTSKSKESLSILYQIQVQNGIFMTAAL